MEPTDESKEGPEATPSPLTVAEERFVTTVEDLLETMREGSVILQKFSRDGRAPFLKRIMSLEQQLRVLDVQAAEFKSKMIPLGVISLVDEGKSPRRFSEDAFDACRKSCSRTHGRLQGYKSFLRFLEEQASRAFPQDYAAYVELTGRSAAERLSS